MTRRLARFNSATLLLLLFPLWGCGDQSVDPEPEPDPDPPDTVTVYLEVVPDTIVPGQSSVVTIGAQLPDTEWLVVFQLAVSGLGGDTIIPLPVVHAGSHEYRLEVHIPTGPIEGKLDFALLARARSGSDSTTASLVIRDDGPPRLEVTVADVTEPSDSLIVTYRAEDAAGIASLGVLMTGAVERSTFANVDYRASIQGHQAAWVPPGTHLGDAVMVTVTTTDGFGNETAVERVVRVADSTAPTMRFTIDTVHHPELDPRVFPLAFMAGDTLRIDLIVSDNHSLTWFGYRMLEFGDSVTTDSATDSVRFEFEIPQGTNSYWANIHLFAADSSGNSTEEMVYAVAMDGRIRPIDAIDPYASPLIDWDQQGHYAFDVKRDVLYVADFLSKLNVVSLDGVTEELIEFGRSVRGVDLTPSGDSLVVALEGQPNLLLVWDIDRGRSVIDTIVVAFGQDCHLWHMQIAANGHALVTGWSRSACPTIDIDLATRAQRYRQIPDTVRNLASSGDGRTVILWNQNDALIYWSDTDSLSALINLFPTYHFEINHAGPSLDHLGNSVLIRNRLYDSELSNYRWLLPDPGGVPPAQALSADGRTAFFGACPGYWKVDVATGEVLERVILPRIADRIVAHPDGRRLIVFGWMWMGVVDLQ